MERAARILIVDDEKIVCEMGRRCFEEEGYDVTTFTDSTEALATLQEERFDVLIADIKMKGVDGIELLKFTRNRWPETRVIMLTAFATLETAAKALHQQAFDYFAKPVRIADLKASVHRALQARTTDKEENPDG